MLFESFCFVSSDLEELFSFIVLSLFSSDDFLSFLDAVFVDNLPKILLFSNLVIFIVVASVFV